MTELSTTEPSTPAQHQLIRNRQNEEFLRRLFERRPQARALYESRLAQPQVLADFGAPGAVTETSAPDPRPIALETIVNEERPVLFVKEDWLDTVNVTAIGVEAEELIRALDDEKQTLQPLMPLIGRIDVTNFPNADFVGTGWLVDTDIVVTNRHVANLIARWDGRQFAFSRGIAGALIGSSFDTLHEFDDLAVGAARAFTVKEVLYIEPGDHGPDIAFLRVGRRTDGTGRDRIDVATADVGENTPIVVVGYPARAPRSIIPDQRLMNHLYRDRYDVKRAAPGLIMNPERGSTRHDSTTLGGCSGGCVIDIKTGKAVGLHFAGLYLEANFAVPATVLQDYIRRKRWNEPVTIESAPQPATSQAGPKPPQPQAPVVAVAGASVAVTIPLSIVISLGQPVVGDHPAAAEAAGALPDERAGEVVAVRLETVSDHG